jgi:hypothetical protein
MKLDEQNRKLIFDTDTAIDLDNEDQVINGMIGKLK